MDDLSYSYFREPLSWNNKLLGVNDNAAAGNYDNDLDDMGLIQGNLSSTWNYNYDEIGNLVLDKQEYIDNIEWTVSGKVKKVIKKKTLKQKDVDRDGVVDAEDDLNTDGIADEIVLQDLEFVYDATGNRICKIVKPHLRSTDTGFPGLTSQDHWTYTYYVRDAQGSVLATYNRSFTHGTGSNYTDLYDLSELDIYGSSRVGMVKDADVSLSRAFTASIGTDNLFSSVSYASVTPPISCTTCPRSYSRTLGHKQYELSNHLGNVIATVSDRKLMVQHATTLTLVDHYMPDVLSANDYYAFGLNMPGRSFSGNGYRYGFNGKESDSEWDGGGSMYDYGFRIYNPRLGKFLSVDPLTRSYPMLTPYQFASNTPIYAIDLDGLEGVGASTITTSFIARLTTSTAENIKQGNSVGTAIFKASVKTSLVTASPMIIGSVGIYAAPYVAEFTPFLASVGTRLAPYAPSAAILLSRYGNDAAGVIAGALGYEGDIPGTEGDELGKLMGKTIEKWVGASGRVIVRYSNVALGKTDRGLKQFAQKMSANFYGDWVEAFGLQNIVSWESKFFKVLSETVKDGGNIIFNVGGTGKNGLLDIEAAKKGFTNLAEAQEMGKWTEWELSQILRDKELFEKTIFHVDGVEKTAKDLGLEYIKD